MNNCFGNWNKCGVKYQLYPISTNIEVFGLKMCLSTGLTSRHPPTGSDDPEAPEFIILFF